MNALTRRDICPEVDDLDCAKGGTPVSNPLFVNASGPGRDPGLVYLAGIVGVPWQDLQAKTIIGRDGTPVAVPPNELRYVAAADALMSQVWPNVLGADGVPPRDALMRESIAPRAGDGPLPPGEPALATLQPASAALLANPANGHERTISGADDLQHACIFRLPAPRDCAALDGAGPDAPACDCTEQAVVDQNPLCQQEDGSYSRIQRYAKAYPGIRQLEVLRGFGNNAIPASICGRNLADPTRQDYGYRPATDAIADGLKRALIGRCLPRKLQVGGDGNVPCTIIEARDEGTYDASRGRGEVRPEHVGSVRARLQQRGVCGGTGQPSCDSKILCEIARADETCLENVPYEGTPGWCYVDPLPPAEGGQSIGDPALVAQCREPEKRIVRFVDPAKRTPIPGSTVLIVCEGADVTEQ